MTDHPMPPEFCKHCGQPIGEDDLVFRTIHPWGYAHESCPAPKDA